MIRLGSQWRWDWTSNRRTNSAIAEMSWRLPILPYVPPHLNLFRALRLPSNYSWLLKRRLRIFRFSPVSKAWPPAPGSPLGFG